MERLAKKYCFKRTTMTLIVALFTVASATAQDEGTFELKNGEATMAINANKGGKILSLRYQDREMLSQ